MSTIPKPKAPNEISYTWKTDGEFVVVRYRAPMLVESLRLIMRVRRMTVREANESNDWPLNVYEDLHCRGVDAPILSRVEIAHDFLVRAVPRTLRERVDFTDFDDPQTEKALVAFWTARSPSRWIDGWDRAKWYKTPPARAFARRACRMALEYNFAEARKFLRRAFRCAA